VSRAGCTEFYSTQMHRSQLVKQERVVVH